MVNDNNKQKAILGELHIQERQLRGKIFRAIGLGDELALETYGNEYQDKSLQYGQLWHSAQLVNQSSVKRIQRIKHRIANSILTGQAIFTTLTFNDKTLNSTTPQTRRKYVTLYLKANCSHYVANIDYGKLNEREHYHAINIGELNLSQWHKYGAIKVERIGKTDKDITKLAKYVAKLTNHAIKETTKAPRIIYSRHT